MDLNTNCIRSSPIAPLPATHKKCVESKLNETPTSKSVATNNSLALRYAINSASTSKFTDNYKEREDSFYHTKDGSCFPWKISTPKEVKVKAVVIGIPGMGSGAPDLDSLTDVLLPQNIALYALGLRGQGEDLDVKRRGNELNIKQLLSDISDAIAAVRQKYPDVPILIYAESMGALLATLLSKNQSSLPPITGIILATPVVELARPPSPFIRKIISLVRWIPFLKIPAKWFTKDAAPLSHDPEKERFLKNVPYRIDKYSPSFLHNMGLLMTSANQIAEQIRGPVLVLGAKKDDFIDPNQLKQWVNRVGSSDKTLMFFDSYHRLLFDRQAPEVLDTISRWLKQRLA